MQTLATITEQAVNPGAPVVDTSRFKHRRAVRAVVLDGNGQVALLNVSRRGFHKLPGGGIEKGEAILKALERELLEEIGGRAEVIGEIGKTLEYRDQWQLFQESYCYLAKLKGALQPVELTEQELSDGFEPMWAADIDQAIALLESDNPNNYDGQHIQPRDIIFLKAAKKLLG